MDLFDESVPQDDYQREERCRKAIKALSRAIAVRVAVVVLLLLACFRGIGSPWLVAMVLLVALISLSAMPILMKEWKARRKELKEILDSEE